jgi:hypothetical protein
VRAALQDIAFQEHIAVVVAVAVVEETLGIQEAEVILGQLQTQIQSIALQ